MHAWEAPGPRHDAGLARPAATSTPAAISASGSRRPDYLRMSYYEKWFAALCELLLIHGPA